MPETTGTDSVSRRSECKQFRPFWRRHGLLLIAACLFITGLVLGLLGFRQYFADHNVQRSPLDALYLTLQLFTLESGSVDPPIPPLLNVARFVAFLATLVTVVAAGIELFRDECRLVWIRWRYRDHDIICGLGRTGLKLVEDLRRSGKKVVVIEGDAQNDRIPVCRELGAIVLVGDPRSETLLRMARVVDAQHVVAVCEDDMVNVEIAVTCEKLVEHRKGKDLQCFVEVLDLNLCRALREQEDLSHNKRPFQVTLFNTYENAARQLFSAHPLDGDEGIREPDATQAHLVVVGFGWMGQTVAIKAAGLAHFANRKHLRLTAVDMQIDQRMMEFRGRRPYFDKTCEFDPHAGNADDLALLDEIAGWASEPHTKTMVVVCLDDESKGFLFAMNLLPKIVDTDARIYVRATEGESVRVLMGMACAEEEDEESADALAPRAAGQLAAFGTVDECCSFAAIIDEEQDRVAKAIHGRYLRQQTSREDYQPRPSTQEWPKLAHDYQESNRHAADHIAVKLRAIGCISSREGPGSRDVSVISEIDTEILAQMEHARWCAERYLAGWSLGPDDPKRKTSPHLVPWDSLDEKIKAYDREQVRNIPHMLVEELKEKIYRRTED